MPWFKNKSIFIFFEMALNTHISMDLCYKSWNSKKMKRKMKMKMK
ncbi:hypothetical protein RV14_GL001644 [Enterococcus ratti]|uniref:Uncharacterized protein n=1 Tax=Enterococcus ratti TaxID=150033 RepID=A0A1L8WQJ7_9ENTE|nr:hypothetical protein RV14_GL001644 [Enterococcus ratti]